MTIVLDSWAVIRYLDDEATAAQAVADLLEEQRPSISWINLGVVASVIQRRHGEDAATTTVRDLLDVMEGLLPKEVDVLAAARIKAQHPMAYADAFAAATAIDRDATLWTGDAELLIEGAPWNWDDLR